MTDVQAGRPANPKDVCGTKRLCYMEHGYLTEFGNDQPVRMLGPVSELRDRQKFEIVQDRDQQDAFKIMSTEHKDRGLHFQDPAYPNTLVVMSDRPCSFRIVESDRGQGWYLLRPIKEQPNCPGCMLGMAQQLVYPPMIAMMPSYLERFSWKIENA